MQGTHGTEGTPEKTDFKKAETRTVRKVSLMGIAAGVNLFYAVVSACAAPVSGLALEGKLFGPPWLASMRLEEGRSP